MDGIEALLAPSIESQLLARGDPLSVRAAVLIQDLKVQDAVYNERTARMRESLEEAANLAIDVITTVIRAKALHRIYYRHGEASIARWKEYVSHVKEMVPRLNKSHGLALRWVCGPLKL